MYKDFSELIRRFEDGDKVFIPQKVQIKIPCAEQRLRDGLNFFVKKYSYGEVDKATWIERNYRPVVDWMTDNKGRGLLMTGSCGLGKSLIGKHILPLLIQDSCRKIVNIFSAQELNANIDMVMRYHLVYIDDIGTENLSNVYGNVRCAFSELCNVAEQKGKLLIISTNLTVAEMSEKYGERTIDRLRAITKFVPFSGKSLRK